MFKSGAEMKILEVGINFGHTWHMQDWCKEMLVNTSYANIFIYIKENLEVALARVMIEFKGTLSFVKARIHTFDIFTSISIIFCPFEQFIIFLTTTLCLIHPHIP